MSALPATVADVLAIAPELKPAETAQPVRFALIVDTFTFCMLVQSHWGNVFSEAHTLLAAHFLTHEYNAAAGVSGGAVAARAIDKISESYAVITFDDPELQSTFYGRMLLQKWKAIRIKQSRSISSGNEPPDFTVPDKRIH